MYNKPALFSAHCAMTAPGHPAYPVVSSLPSSQSDEQSQMNDLSIQVIPPDLQVNQPVGHS